MGGQWANGSMVGTQGQASLKDTESFLKVILVCKPSVYPKRLGYQMLDGPRLRMVLLKTSTVCNKVFLIHE